MSLTLSVIEITCNNAKINYIFKGKINNALIKTKLIKTHKVIIYFSNIRAKAT